MKKILFVLSVLLVAVATVHAQATKPSTNGTDHPALMSPTIHRDTMPHTGTGRNEYKNDKMRHPDSMSRDSRMKNSNGHAGMHNDTMRSNRLNKTPRGNGSTKTDPNGTGQGRTDPPPAPDGMTNSSTNGSGMKEGANSNQNSTSTGTGTSKTGGTTPATVHPNKQM